MRKLFIIMFLVSFLMGCQSPEIQSSQTPQKESIKISFHQSYEHQGITFELIDMLVDKVIYPANTNSKYDYVHFDENTDYEMLDIVMCLTNKSYKSLQANSDFRVKLKTKNDVIKMECYIESKEITSIQKDAAIDKDETVLLHMNATIDSQQREENLRLSFYIEDQEYVVDFIYKDYQNQKQIIELNQVLDMNNELSMKFDDLGILNKVLPDDTSGEYFYFELEDKKNLFLYGSCDFENKSHHDMKLADLPALRIRGQNIHLFHIAKQTKDKRDFVEDENTVIQQGEKCRIFYYIELPKDIFFNDIYKNKQKIEMSYKIDRYLLKIPE